MSVTEHKEHVPKVNCMVLTISDTRTEETDKSGDNIVSFLEKNGHHIH